jgi:hypothetical protein
MRRMIEQTWAWDEAWQQQDFDRRFRECTVSIIENDGRAIGALLLESTPDSIYVHELESHLFGRSAAVHEQTPVASS